MKSFLCSILFVSLLPLFTVGQSVVIGRIVDKDDVPIPGANVMVAGTYNGTSTDAEGMFLFEHLCEAGVVTVQVSSLGFDTYENDFTCVDTIRVLARLEVAYNELNAVQITAGSFSASDEKRSANLTPMDVYTSPISQGDLMRALSALPGTQPISSTGELLVRGGDGSESITIIDGALASEPYESTTPDLPSRGSFSSSLFEGIQFSTGGYSARYGQALSSVLQLNSVGVASKDVFSLSVNSTGVGASTTLAGKNQSISLDALYGNMTVYNKIVSSDFDYTKPHEQKQASVLYRLQPTRTGLFKAFVQGKNNRVGYRVYNAHSDYFMALESTDWYGNVHYCDQLSETMGVQVSYSHTSRDQALNVDAFRIFEHNQSHDCRLHLTHDLGKGNVLSYGGSYTVSRFNKDVAMMDEAEDSDVYNRLFHSTLTDRLLGAYTELEVRPSEKISVRFGGRYEYNYLLGKESYSPRVAAAYSFGSMGQLSLAYGLFYQTPGEDFLSEDSSLGFQQAEHWIVNYQCGDAQKRMLRLEAYCKLYDHLVAYDPHVQYSYNHVRNDGFGYAKGIDLFFRDKISIKGFEYWINYSYVDAQRKYNDYHVERTPDFVGEHSFSTNGKYWIPSLNVLLGASYVIGSPRVYVNERNDSQESYKTNAYQDLSLSASYIFYIGDTYSVVHAFVSNVLNRDNIMGYNYPFSETGDVDRMIPQYNPSSQFFFLGLFLNF